MVSIHRNCLPISIINMYKHALGRGGGGRGGVEAGGGGGRG